MENVEIATAPSNSQAAAPRKTKLQLFVRFVAVGVLNTAFGYSVYAAIYLTTHQYVAAVVGANVVGTLFNFFSIGRLVFASKGFKAFLPFVLGYALVLGANLSLVALVTRMGAGGLLAQLIATPFLVLLSFGYNAYVTFRTSQA